MWPYWLMFLLSAGAALEEEWRAPGGATGRRFLRVGGAWLLVILILTLLIGLRHQVGGDWGNYLDNLVLIQGLDLDRVLVMSDPGYQLLGWVSLRVGWGIYGVNLLGGGLFAVGLVMFCRSLPRPWLALVVSVPYLLIVVAMGYSRQGFALGAAMLGLVALGRQRVTWFVAWVLVGATFHKTAVILLPIAALAATRNRYWTILWVGVMSFVAYGRLLEDSLDALYANYVQAQYQSQGALIRILMNALPAAILLRWRRRFLFTEIEAQLWFWCSVLSLILLVLVFVSPSTTAVDRIGLYMLPLQLVVFAHLPEVFGMPGRPNRDLVAFVLLYYAAVQFVWLNFAAHAGGWIPYRFLLFESGV
jgi:hypothetical protein